MRTLAAFRTALARLRHEPIDPTTIRRAVLHHQQTGELPAPGRLRDTVSSIGLSVAEMERASDGSA